MKAAMIKTAIMKVGHEHKIQISTAATVYFGKHMISDMTTFGNIETLQREQLSASDIHLVK